MSIIAFQSVIGQEDLAERLKNLDEIVVPELDFTDASLYDVVDFLLAAEKSLLEEEPYENHVGIIIDLNEGLEAKEEEDREGAFFGDPRGKEDRAEERVTLFVDDVTLAEALDIVCRMHQLEPVMSDGELGLKLKEKPEPFVPRFYFLGPGAFDLPPAKPGRMKVPAIHPLKRGQDVSAFLGAEGIPFPPGTSAFLGPKRPILSVVHSLEQHARLEKILERLMDQKHGEKESGDK